MELQKYNNVKCNTASLTIQFRIFYTLYQTFFKLPILLPPTCNITPVNVGKGQINKNKILVLVPGSIYKLTNFYLAPYNNNHSAINNYLFMYNLKSIKLVKTLFLIKLINTHSILNKTLYSDLIKHSFLLKLFTIKSFDVSEIMINYPITFLYKYKS